MNEVKIILTGAAGRMGHAVLDSAGKDERFSVVAAVDVNGSDISEIPFYHGIGEVSETLGADVIIDFSHHSATEGILEYAKKAGCAAIICTTGHTEDEMEMIKAASKEIPVFRSGNMSLGINLLMALVEKAASVLEGYDAEIIEKHHNQKLDAPSGTALMLAEAVKDGVKYDPEYVFDRHSVRKKREKTEIGIHSVRGGTIVGEHEVMFCGNNEIIALSHSAQSREVFADGALKAALFMKGKPAGFYTMKEVIAEVM